MTGKPKASKAKLTDWREVLKKDPRVIRFQQANRDVLANLRSDKTFLVETERLRRGLEKACEDSKEKKRQILRFFKKFPGPLARRSPAVEQHLRSAKMEDLRQLLSRYVHHSVRFNVFFRRNSKQKWVWVPQVLPWKSFHMKIESGKLKPMSIPIEDEHFVDLLATESLGVLPALQRLPSFRDLLNAGRAKFALVEDDGSKSLLSQLEEVTYSPTALTFIVHRTEQPYLLLLIGEKVSTEVIRKAGKVVTYFQRECQKRTHAGRPAKIGKLKTALNLLSKPGTMKQKSLGEDTKFHSQQVYLANLKTEIIQSH